MIEFKSVSKTYSSGGRMVHAVGPFSLEIKKGEFVSIVGPSGCGKSTLLNMLAGFLPITSGEICVAGKAISKELPDRLGYIFQRDTVLPWFTVFDNVALGPRFRKMPEEQIRKKVRELLKVGQLEKFSQSFPHQLSGGMRRRLALLMSLACEPELLLLDEPFGALDTHTRTNLHQELINIWREQGQTMVLITHDLDEAITLSDRVIVLSKPPSRVLLDERIDIPHPRDVYSVRQSNQFTLHYQRIWAVLGEQFKNDALAS